MCMCMVMAGNGNATVDVGMFSEELSVPMGLANSDIWVDDEFTKTGRLIK